MFLTAFKPGLSRPEGGKVLSSNCRPAIPGYLVVTSFAVPYQRMFYQTKCQRLLPGELCPRLRTSKHELASATLPRLAAVRHLIEPLLLFIGKKCTQLVVCVFENLLHAGRPVLFVSSVQKNALQLLAPFLKDRPDLIPLAYIPARVGRERHDHIPSEMMLLSQSPTPAAAPTKLGLAFKSSRSVANRCASNLRTGQVAVVRRRE